MRKRRRRSLAIAIGLPLGVAVGFGVWTASANGVDVVHAASRHAQDLIELLDQRSPGVRTAAELTKIKRARPASYDASVARRSPPPPPVGSPAHLADLLSGPADLSFPQISGSFAPLQPVAFSSDVVIGGGGSGSDNPASSLMPPGTETSASLPSAETHLAVVETPAVPEPESWALMLIGFALVGWKVRRSVNAGGNRQPSAG